MVSTIEAYQEFMALRHHFTTESYDYIKYGGKIKISWRENDNFERRKDYFQFQKLSKHPDLQNFILANILQKPKIWIYELNSDESEKTYIEWKKRKESFSYIFKQEISTFPDNMYKEGYKIELIPSYFQGEICFETLYVLYMFINIYDIAFIVDNPLFDEIEFKLKKYKPFMERNFLMDENKILNIAFEKFGFPAKEEY